MSVEPSPWQDVDTALEGFGLMVRKGVFVAAIDYGERAGKMDRDKMWAAIQAMERLLKRADERRKQRNMEA